MQLSLFHVIFTQVYTLDIILLFYTMLAGQESAFLYRYKLEMRIPLEIHKISKNPNMIQKRGYFHYLCKPL
jgi:hypothetical protein